jgi:hypothetical protein
MSRRELNQASRRHGTSLAARDARGRAQTSTFLEAGTSIENNCRSAQPMSLMGQSATWRHRLATSDLAQISDIGRGPLNVRLVPIGDISAPRSCP